MKDRTLSERLLITIGLISFFLCFLMLIAKPIQISNAVCLSFVSGWTLGLGFVLNRITNK